MNVAPLTIALHPIHCSNSVGTLGCSCVPDSEHSDLNLPVNSTVQTVFGLPNVTNAFYAK
jgi:hypothetical protein